MFLRWPIKNFSKCTKFNLKTGFDYQKAMHITEAYKKLESNKPKKFLTKNFKVKFTSKIFNFV